jgi:Tfp pilus assembly protein PilF
MNARLLRINRIKSLLLQQPQDSFLLYALALEHVGVQDFVSAKSIFEDLIHHQPDYLPTYYQLAKVYEALQMNDQAVQTYEKGLLCAQTQQDAHTMSELKAALDELRW